VVNRDPAVVKTRATGVLANLLNDKDLTVRMSAVKAVSKLDIRQAGPALLGLLKNDLRPEVRVEALRALAFMKDEQIQQAIQSGLADKDKMVRIAGIDLIGTMDIPKDLMVNLLSDVINTKTTEEKQAALLTLGNLPVKNSEKVFQGLLSQMEAGKLPSEVYLELSEAIDSTRSQPLVARYKQISSKFSPDELLSSYAGSLNGGDPEKGKNIFFRNQEAQCIRCHSYDDIGGNAGPRLNGVAKRLTRPQLLEALINPSARLAPGFGVVTVNLKNGKTVSGVLQDENAKNLVVSVGAQQKEVVPKDQVSKRINAASSMPEMRYILSKKEIRDVVSFLSTLREDK
jgi:putative heme-binding domain-containing protein